MNVSSETLAFPLTHQPHRRVFTSNHTSMLINASPIAVSNKIRAIQTRKSRINLQSYGDYTDIRPLNLTSTNRLSPEKLVERSKELRLGRLPTRANPRQSILSTTTVTNQTSLIWPSLTSQNAFQKQPSTIDSPTTITHTMNKSFNGNIPDIHQRSSRAQSTARQLLGEQQQQQQQQNVLSSIEPRHRSLPKTKSSKPTLSYQTLSKTKAPNTQPIPTTVPNETVKQTTNNNFVINLYENEEDDGQGVLIMDEEFKEYFQKAIVKCADWLLKYVIDKTYDNEGDEKTEE